VTTSFVKENFTLDDFVASPPERTEWVDGQLVEKNDMTLRHGEIQLRLGRYWED
jgi:Uma2 family endonuclease